MKEQRKSVDEVLRGLGVNPEEKTTVKFEMWQPWADTKETENQPQGFKGVYAGYKPAQKMIDGEISHFEVFNFDMCTPAPDSGAAGYCVSSSYQLEELKRVQPGTQICIVFSRKEKNATYGSAVPIVEWYFANKKDRETRVAATPLPPSGRGQILEPRRSLPANGHQTGEDNDIPF